MRNLLIALVIALMTTACGSQASGDRVTVKVLEVQQAGNYTYLYVKGKGPKHWVAVPSMNASPGETYTYQGGLLMTDFYSKELDRTFDEVLFIESLNSLENQAPESDEMVAHHGRIPVEKKDANVEAVEGTVSIADLYADPEAYKGKKVRVKGEVSKYNPEIMDRNWIHLQDGTEFEGKYDLTATSSESFETGSVVILEGVIALDRDFGYGYSYDILLENATAVK